MPDEPAGRDEEGLFVLLGWEATVREEHDLALAMLLRGVEVVRGGENSLGVLRSGSSAHPGGQSARPVFQSCFLLRGESTPVSVSHDADPERPESAEHTRQEHPDQARPIVPE